MTIQPDELAFYHPHEADDGPVRLVSLYTDDTEPNEPVRDIEEAKSIVVKHVTEFVAADTEDPTVRWCCLVADLGYPVPEEVFWELADAYADVLPFEQAQDWKASLHEYLAPYTEERP